MPEVLLPDCCVELLLRGLCGLESSDELLGLCDWELELLDDGELELLDDGELELLEDGELELLEDGELELLLPLEEAPSAESVCWSSWPEAEMPCCCWNCSMAACVFGPSWPSTLPTSRPLSFSACWAWRTVELSWPWPPAAGLCDDALCEEPGCDEADCDEADCEPFEDDELPCCAVACDESPLCDEACLAWSPPAKAAEADRASAATRSCLGVIWNPFL